MRKLITVRGFRVKDFLYDLDRNVFYHLECPKAIPDYGFWLILLYSSRSGEYAMIIRGVVKSLEWAWKELITLPLSTRIYISNFLTEKYGSYIKNHKQFQWLKLNSESQK
jgi:hypothetical protein